MNIAALPIRSITLTELRFERLTEGCGNCKHYNLQNSYRYSLDDIQKRKILAVHKFIVATRVSGRYTETI